MAPTKRKSATFEPSPSTSPPTTNPPSKRSKKSTTTTTTNTGTPSFTSSSLQLPQPKKDEDSNTYWDLSSTRRITLSTFNGKKMVSVREYYQKDSRWLPGKKGISMTLDQFGVLVGVLPQIERVLRNEGEGGKIGRPRYDRDDDLDGVGGDGDVGNGDQEEEDRKERKANIEATSDEDED